MSTMIQPGSPEGLPPQKHVSSAPQDQLLDQLMLLYSQIKTKQHTTGAESTAAANASVEALPAEYMVDDIRAADQIQTNRKSTRLNSSHIQKSRMPSSA